MKVFAVAALSISVACGTQSPGSLQIEISGLPQGVDASVSVAGPNASPQQLTASQTLTGLLPGSYAVTAASVNGYAAAVTGSPAPVANGKTSTVTVVYSGQTSGTGSMSFAVQGLPGGVAPSILVTGPGGYSNTVTSAATVLSGLVPGAYTVQVQPVFQGDYKLAAAATVLDGNVVAGQTVNEVAIYACETSDIDIAVSGLPAGVSASGGLYLSASDRLQDLTATTHVSGLTSTGPYSAEMIWLTAPGGVEYAPAVTPASFSTRQCNASQVAVVYSPAGSLTVNFNGPGQYISVAGPNGFASTLANLTTTYTYHGLAPGSYTVTAQGYTAGNVTYAATVGGSPADVEPGAPATVNVSYAAAPTTGSLTVTTTGGDASGESVSGPNSFNRFGLSPSPYTLGNLASGSYTVSAPSYTSNGLTFTSVVTGSPASVTAGGSAQVSVAYSAPLPVITSVTPDVGVDGAGGGTVNIFGTNFGSSATVTIDGIPATPISIFSTLIEVKAPAHAVGLVDVRVTTAAGTSAISAADQLHYYHFEYFTLPTKAGEGGMTVGPDGNVWFTERDQSRIGKVTPSGAITEYTLPGGNESDPVDIAAGPDGNLWFGDYLSARIFRSTTGGAITPIALTSGCNAFSFSNGPGGLIWFDEFQCPTGTQNKIASVSTDGKDTVTEYEIPGSFPLVFGITEGADGDVWWGEYDTLSIGTMSGTTISHYGTNFTVAPSFLCLGPDAQVYFMDDAGKIDAIDTSGNVHRYTVSGGTNTETHCAGDASGVWYPAQSSLSFFDTTVHSGNVTYPLAGNGTAVAVDASGAVWFMTANYDVGGDSAVGRFTR